MKRNVKSYVLWMEFDRESMDYLEGICARLSAAGVESGILPPHMTIAFVTCDDEERLKTAVHSFLADKKFPDLYIGTIGVFKEQGTVIYLSPVVTVELLQLHAELCRVLSDCGELHRRPYVPGGWIPHIALTGGLYGEASELAYNIILCEFEKRNLKPGKIALRTEGENILSIIL
jgi:2''-5'' RNA ligase